MSTKYRQPSNLQLAAPEPTAERVAVALAGVNHRSATVAVRERLAMNGERQERALEEIFSLSPVDEAVVVSTCNRVELVIAGKQSQLDLLTPELDGIFSRISGVSTEALRPHLYQHSSRGAVNHLFRVAAGLDSMVLGEPQILGQLKTAYRVAQEVGTTKSVLNRLFHRAFRVAKVVRTRTKIGHHAVSVCFAAREVAQQIFGDLRDASVMVFGAGEMGTLALKHFQSAGAVQPYVVNKTLARACELAEQSGGVPLTFQNVPSFLSKADVVIGACTLTPGDPPLVTRAQVEAAQRLRQGRPQFFVDLSVPRNFDTGLDGLSDVFLYNIDDLDSIVQRNLAGRELEVDRAQVFVDEEVDRFCGWLAARDVENSIRELASQVNLYSDIEIAKTLRRLRREGGEGISETQLQAALQDLANGLLAKVLHQPITSVRELSAVEPSALAQFRKLFLAKRGGR